MARNFVIVHTQLHHRDTDVANIFPDEIRMKPLGVVVYKVTSGPYGSDIPGIGLRIDANDQVNGFTAANIPFVVYPDFKPRRKPLDVGGKNIL
jgi:hypothetical protein